MKHFIFYFLFVVICSPLMAKHILGGTMSYENQGLVSSNMTKYRINVELYRDCGAGNASFDNTIQVCIYTNNQLLQSLDVDVFSNSLPISTSPYAVCMEKAIYVGFVTLPLSNVGYTLVYRRCCRNATTGNIDFPSDVGFAISTTIPSNNIVNSSPIMSNLYPFFGNNFVFNHSIVSTDLDNDVVVQTIASPQGGGSSDDPIPVCSSTFFSNYILALNPNYSLQNLLNSTVPLTTTLNGVLHAEGLLGGEYDFAIDTKEYRNGNVISTTHSEFSLNIFFGYVANENALSQVTFQLSPNPTSHSLSISLPDYMLKGYEIFSLEGKKLASGNETTVDISALAAGMYILSVSTDKGVGRQFFVKE